jgi:aromatic-L-amino-acid decarboxylase
MWARAEDPAVADERTRRILADVNRGQRVFLSSTVVGGRFTLRLAIGSHRTHLEHVDAAVDAIIAAARAVSGV